MITTGGNDWTPHLKLTSLGRANLLLWSKFHIYWEKIDFCFDFKNFFKTFGQDLFIYFHTHLRFRVVGSWCLSSMGIEHRIQPSAKFWKSLSMNFSLVELIIVTVFIHLKPQRVWLIQNSAACVLAKTKI